MGQGGGQGIIPCRPLETPTHPAIFLCDNLWLYWSAFGV